MNTRSKTKRLAQPRGSREVCSESDALVVGGLGRSSKLDHVLAEATFSPTTKSVPGTSRESPILGKDKPNSVSRSHFSGASRSTHTIRARRLTAEAQLARRNLEREHELFKREQQLVQDSLDFERKFIQKTKQMEELELEASLAQEVKKHSVSPSCSRLSCSSWVDDVNKCIPKLTSERIQTSMRPADNLDFKNKEYLPKIEAKDVISSHRFSDKYIKLMPFFGKPTEWLMFKRTYSDTKHLFTPTENLARLRCALRGRALECVSALLYTTEQPEEVLDMLEQTFALPEIIVLHEISLVRNLPRISYDQKELNSFACRLRNCIAVINNLEQKEYLYSIEIFHTVLSKLTPILYSQWKDFAYHNSLSVPKLQLLSEFLSIEADKHNRFGLVLEYAKRPGSQLLKANTNHRETINAISTRSPNSDQCSYCNNKHNLNDCKDFKALSLDDKWRWLRDFKICYKCLKSKIHRWKTCKISRCGVDGCERFHNPLLHSPSTPRLSKTDDNTSSSYNVGTDSNDNKPMIISNITESIANNKGVQRVFLKVIPVEVSGPNGKYDTFALLDDGSTATLIDSEVADHIGATGPSKSIKVEGIAGMSTCKVVKHVSFSIKGRNCSEVFAISNVKAMDTLSLLSQTINRDDLSQFPYLIDLVDQLTLIDATPKILIGAEHWYLTVSREVREGSKNQPVATRTALGWVLHGKSNSWTKTIEFVNHVSVDSCSESTMDNLIKDYFRLDAIGISKLENLCSKHDKYALETLETTTKRLKSGRFEVGLLWQKDIPIIPDSYPHALSRFLGLEKRMARDVEFKKAYCTFMNDMIEKEYAEECSRNTYHDTVRKPAGKPIRWYLPHFPVVHPQKNKLRVVHDAAAKTSGVSLNSLLLQGPDLLQSLLHILFRFREGRVALTADVKEMFPQIKIREEDRDALRYIWREDCSCEIKEYRMTSVIFGAVCSPSIALYIKNRNAQELRTSYTAAAKAVIDDHYMDDYVGSIDDENQAAQLAADIVSVHKAAGMEMRAWVSNVPAALTAIPEALLATPPKNVGPEFFVRTLGLIWNPQSDTFSFRSGIEIPENEKLTKRKILSYLMCVYDPQGFFTPLVIQGRILFQQIWRTGIGWDTELQPDTVKKWLFWSQQLATISDVKIPRWYRCGFQGKDISDRQLHVFADASEEAYSCVAYWRFVFTDDSVKLSLIGGKARLAPLKPSSIPRLELQAALIAARFANTVCVGHKIQPDKIYFWSDSTTVLSWIRSDARTFKPFVANRVGEITEITNVESWKFVPGGLNVADNATRLINCHKDLKRWFSGPSFLLLPVSDWPSEPSASEASDTLEELKPSKVVVGLVQVSSGPSSVVPDLSHFSEWRRLVRATARVHQSAYKFRSLLARFKEKDSKLIKTKFDSKYLMLTAIDIKKAEIAIFKKSQIDCFSQEIALLHNSKPLLKSSKLFSLCPILDEDGLLRLDSRIKHMRNIDYETISPIILDGHHPAVRLLIRHYHVKAAHAFNELVCNELKQRYWILRCRSEVRMTARRCMYCTKRRATPQIPPIGDLPEVRLDHHTRPFTNVGLDYFGPVDISIGRRREKRWIALFTCMTTRAVHLEIVASLSADSAISSLRRFIARRGIPRKIITDNGTSFVGANRQLMEFYSEPVQDFAADSQCEWSFIPPASPFMGGCWERLVRTVKTALLATLNEKAPKEEVLHTLLLEAEALVNSRPLTYVAQNEECQSLTPFHFLIGASSNQQLPVRLEDGVFSLRKEWQKVLRLSEHFWSRWLREYLPILKPKRYPGDQFKNLEVNDVVLVVDPDLPRGVWPMGRVTKVYPGKDGVVRVAEVATKGGILKRPAKKLAPIKEESIV